MLTEEITIANVTPVTDIFIDFYGSHKISETPIAARSLFLSAPKTSVMETASYARFFTYCCDTPGREQRYSAGWTVHQTRHSSAQLGELGPAKSASSVRACLLKPSIQHHITDLSALFYTSIRRRGNPTLGYQREPIVWMRGSAGILGAMLQYSHDDHILTVTLRLKLEQLALCQDMLFKPFRS